MKSYRDLEIYKEAIKLAVQVHKMSLTLPKHELYETGSQIRRSSKSISSNIAEGFGRKKYKDEFARFIIFAQGSCNETQSHLEIINNVYGSSDERKELFEKYKDLGRKINKFLQYVESNWRSKK